MAFGSDFVEFGRGALWAGAAVGVLLNLAPCLSRDLCRFLVLKFHWKRIYKSLTLSITLTTSLMLSLTLTLIETVEN